MIDLSSFPAGADVRTYTGGNWQTWTKPPRCNFVYVFLLGGGGGGGGGFAAAVGSSKGGGGGGASASLFTALFLGASIPGTLFVQPGVGGTGGSSGSNGTAAGSGFVCTRPNTTALNRVIASAGGTFGAAGTAAGGAGGVGTTTVIPGLANWAIFFSQSSGRSGTNGNILTPLPTSIGTLSPILGGAGGGGYTAAGSPSAGGGMTFSGHLPDLPGGTAGGAVAGRGTDGRWTPPYFFGGTGGGGTNDAVSVGGAGGNGVAPGTGGGGGGAGVTGGRGGNGGPGICIIVSW